MMVKIRVVALCITATLAAVIGCAHDERIAHADAVHGPSPDAAQPLHELQVRVQALEGREAIRILMHDYGRLLDERDFDGFAQLFADRGEYDSGGIVSKGPAAIASFLKDIIGRNPAGYKTPNFHAFFNENIGFRVTAALPSASPLSLSRATAAKRTRSSSPTIMMSLFGRTVVGNSCNE